MEAILDGWDRQCQIVMAVAGRVTDANKDARASASGRTLAEHLAHIHEARKFHLSQLDSSGAKALEDAQPGDLEQTKACLEESGKAVREALAKGGPSGAFDHPALLSQILISHEGWHLALIVLALELAGEEPPHMWQEVNIWGQWRND